MTTFFDIEFTISQNESNIILDITSGERFTWTAGNTNIRSVIGTTERFLFGGLATEMIDLDFTKSLAPLPGTTLPAYIDSIMDIINESRINDKEVNGNNINLIRIDEEIQRNDLYGENITIDNIERIIAPNMPLSSGVEISFPLGSTTLQIASTSNDDVGITGIGAREVTIFGLDASFNVISETKVMNGQIPVGTTQSFFRLQETVVFSAGSTENNVGNILTSDVNDTFVAGIPQNRCYDSMGEIASFSKTATFTVPNDQVSLTQSVEVTSTAQPSNQVTVKLIARRSFGGTDVVGLNEVYYIRNPFYIDLRNTRRRLPGDDLFLTAKVQDGTESISTKLSMIVSSQTPGNPNLFG